MRLARYIVLIAVMVLLIGGCGASPVVLISTDTEKPIAIADEKSLTCGDISSVAFDAGASYMTLGDLYIWNTPRFTAVIDQSESIFGSARLDTNKVEYTTGKVELKYEYTDTRLKETIIIGEPTEIVFDLTTNGNIVAGNDGTITVFGKNDTVSIIIEKPFGVDAGGKKFDLDWILDGTVLTLSKLPDGVQYPVTIDPTEVVNGSTRIYYGGVAVIENPTTGKVFVQFASSSQTSYIMERVDATTWVQNATAYTFGSAANSIYVNNETQIFSAGNAYLTRAVRPDLVNNYSSGSKTDLNTNFFGHVAAFSNGTIVVPGISCEDNEGLVLAYVPAALASTTATAKHGHWADGYATAVDINDIVLLGLNNKTDGWLYYVYYDGSYHETSLSVAADDIALAYNADDDILSMLYSAGSNVYYIERAAGITGTWSDPIEVSSQTATIGSGAGIYHSIDIVLDINNDPHGIYAGATGARHVYRNSSGSWFDESLNTTTCIPQVDAFSYPSDTSIHFAWGYQISTVYGVMYYSTEIEEESPPEPTPTPEQVELENATSLPNGGMQIDIWIALSGIALACFAGAAVMISTGKKVLAAPLGMLATIFSIVSAINASVIYDPISTTEVMNSTVTSGTMLVSEVGVIPTYIYCDLSSVSIAMLLISVVSALITLYAWFVNTVPEHETTTIGSIGGSVGKIGRI